MKKCSNCGKDISDITIKCLYCGAYNYAEFSEDIPGAVSKTFTTPPPWTLKGKYIEFTLTDVWINKNTKNLDAILPPISEYATCIFYEVKNIYKYRLALGMCHDPFSIYDNDGRIIKKFDFVRFENLEHNFPYDWSIYPNTIVNGYTVFGPLKKGGKLGKIIFSLYIFPGNDLSGTVIDEETYILNIK